MRGGSTQKFPSEAHTRKFIYIYTYMDFTNIIYLNQGCGVGVWSRSRWSRMFSAGVGVGSRSRFFKTSGVGVGSRSRFFKTAGVGVRSRSRNICCNYRLQCLLNNLKITTLNA